MGEMWLSREPYQLWDVDYIALLSPGLGEWIAEEVGTQAVLPGASLAPPCPHLVWRAVQVCHTSGLIDCSFFSA